MKKIWTLLALSVVAAVWWWGSAGMFGFSRYLPFIMAIAGALFACMLVWLVRYTRVVIWIIAGGLIFVGLFFTPVYSLQFIHGGSPRWLFDTLSILFALLPVIAPSIAIISAGFLLYSGLTYFMHWLKLVRGENGKTTSQGKSAGITVIICLALSALLLAKTLHNLYWVMVWDNTDDPIEYLC